jgi:hypothetical protein
MHISIRIWILCFLFVNIICKGQIDTVVAGVRYNYVKYFSYSKIEELGNYKTKDRNKIKNGYWITYDQNSNMLAKGNYSENRKDGEWTEKESEPDNPDCWTGNYKKGRRVGNWYCENKKKWYKRGKEKGMIIATFS